MINRVRIHAAVVTAIADKLSDALKLSELDSLAIAPHLAAGKRVNVGDIVWLTRSGNVIAVKRRKAGGGTDDGGKFETVISLPENSLDKEHIETLIGKETGTDDPGANLIYNDPT